MDEKRKNRKIASDSFLKYFIMGVPEVELSDKAIREYISKWQKSQNIQEDIRIVLNELKLKRQLNELLTKLKRIYIDELKIKTVNGLIEFIYTNIEDFSFEEEGGFFNSQYDNASSLVLWLINNHFSKDKIPAKLEEVISNTPSYYFKVFVTLFCKKERGDLYNIYEAIDIKTIIAKTTELLEKHYIEEEYDVFDEVPSGRWELILFQWATNWGFLNTTNPQKVNNYVLNILSSSFKKFIIFITSVAKQNFRIEKGKYSFNIQQLGQIYDISILKTFAEKYINESEITLEEKNMVEQFIEQSNQYLQNNKTSI